MPAFGIRLHVGVDGISLLLRGADRFLTPIALLCSWESVHKNVQDVLVLHARCSRAR